MNKKGLMYVGNGIILTWLSAIYLGLKDYYTIFDYVLSFIIILTIYNMKKDLDKMIDGKLEFASNIKCPKCDSVQITMETDDSGVYYYVCGDCDHAWWG